MYWHIQKRSIKQGIYTNPRPEEKLGSSYFWEKDNYKQKTYGLKLEVYVVFLKIWHADDATKRYCKCKFSIFCSQLFEPKDCKFTLVDALFD